MNEKGILFNNFLFDEKNKLEDIINVYGDGKLVFIDVKKGAHTRVAHQHKEAINFPEIKQTYYWVRNSSKILYSPDIWTLEQTNKQWQIIRKNMQKEWNSKKSDKNVYIHFRRWQQFDFWWTQHHIGKRMRLGYYKGSPQIVSFILKESEILNMTKKMEEVPFIEKVTNVMLRKRIPLHDKIKPIKTKRNEFFIPSKFVLDPETVLQFY
jgi:hypothetical protein